MPLELLNTFGTLATVAIVAATAFAALIQLRHLRAGNQINAMISIGDKFQSAEFGRALETVGTNLDGVMEEPAFRDFLTAVFRRYPIGDVGARYKETRHAALLVGNTYEELGILIKNGIVDRDLFLDRYCAVAIGAWRRLENYLAFTRELQADQAIWENFEMIVALSERWVREHPSTYPSNLDRLTIVNPWPITSPAQS
jgi:hypothetical protein